MGRDRTHDDGVAREEEKEGGCDSSVDPGEARPARPGERWTKPRGPPARRPGLHCEKSGELRPSRLRLDLPRVLRRSKGGMQGRAEGQCDHDAPGRGHPVRDQVLDVQREVCKDEQKGNAITTHLDAVTLFAIRPSFSRSWFRWIFENFRGRGTSPRSPMGKNYGELSKKLYDNEIMHLAGFQGDL